MKEYKDESGNPIKEYSFEDWEQGYISGTTTHGRRKVRCTHENGEVSEYIKVLPKAEYDKIQKACKEQFNKRVNREAETLKDIFHKGIDNSLNRAEYIEYEIQRAEYILFKSAREKYTKPEKLNLQAYPNYPQLYERYVIKGDKVYNLEHRMTVLIAPNTNLLRHSARVIALKRHLDWLYELRKNPRAAYQSKKYFWELTDEKLEEIHASHKWKSIQREIDEKGYMGFKWEKISTKVYTTALMYILLNKSVELQNNEKGKEEVVNSRPFRIAFADGFLAGEKHFDKNWQIDRATLISPNADRFIKSLVDNYFKSGFKLEQKPTGWHFVKMNYPIVISEASIYQFGYYSGIVSKADETMAKYRSYFAPYFKPDEQDKINEYSDIETTRDLFEFLSSDEIKIISSRRSETDLRNCIYRLTKGHKLPFLKSLKADLESELELELIEIENKFNHEQILNKAQHFIDRSIEVPLNHGYKFSEDIYQEIKNSPDECRFYIDIEKLMLPMKYGTVRRVINIVSDLIEEHRVMEMTATTKSTKTKPAKDDSPELKDLFADAEWEKYFDVLTKCEPKILEKTATGFKFVGNQSTEKGVVAAWTKYLKLKRIINVEMNRDSIAATLSIRIDNFKIAGSSIDNRSTKYERDFEPQLIDLLKNN